MIIGLLPPALSETVSRRRALEELQGLLHAGGDGFRAKFFQEPAPPAWWEDEVSVVLDPAACRVNGRADDAWFLLLRSGWHGADNSVSFIGDELLQSRPNLVTHFPKST